jgi:hypothetical protein
MRLVAILALNLSLVADTVVCLDAQDGLDPVLSERLIEIVVLSYHSMISNRAARRIDFLAAESNLDRHRNRVEIGPVTVYMEWSNQLNLISIPCCGYVKFAESPGMMVTGSSLNIGVPLRSLNVIWAESGSVMR